MGLILASAEETEDQDVFIASCREFVPKHVEKEGQEEAMKLLNTMLEDYLRVKEEGDGNAKESSEAGEADPIDC